jgi:hypothetical protein
VPAERGDRIVDALLTGVTDLLDPGADVDFASETNAGLAVALPGDIPISSELTAR